MSVLFKLDGQIGIIEFDKKDHKVNVLGPETLAALDAILTEIAENSRIKAVLLVSAKKDVFIAGADIKEIEGITDPAEGEKKSRYGQRIFDKLEDLAVPTIAVIDGVALGGGCELILACKYRVATFNEKIRIGLPEVNLGIIPGFGGCYRLPKLLGLTQALKIILAGRTVSSQEALKSGLVDRLFPSAGLDRSARDFAAGIIAAGKSAPPRRRAKGFQAFLDHSEIGNMLVVSRSRKEVLRNSKGFYPAPLKALEVIQRTLGGEREKAMALEARTFGQLAVTGTCKNLISVFYLSEKYKKLLPPEVENVPGREIRKCGVLGAGVMGGGIAQLLSSHDITVRLKDLNHDALAKGLQSARKVYDQVVKRRKLSAAQALVKMSKISVSTDNSGLAKTDAVIEAVVENMEIKKKVFKEMDAVLSPDAVLCTNTSALPVGEMAKATRHPERVIGFHFFNPVHRMPLIEIIKASHTSPETVATALRLAKRLGKIPILVKDSPGFLVNRILLGYINEAGRILEEDGIRAPVLDRIMTDFGMPMGPFILSDEVGLDVGIKVLHILEEGLGPRFKPVRIFEDVFAQGLFGKKNGKGFYLHQKGRAPAPNPQIDQLLKVKVRDHLSTDDLKEYLDRMLLIMINEAGRCLDEGIADDPSTVDAGMIMGTGFPPFRGGLLRYADARGIEDVVTTLKRLEDKLKSDRFRPCAYLVQLRNGKKSIFTGPGQ